jgi:hypothetical protein
MAGDLVPVLRVEGVDPLGEPGLQAAGVDDPVGGRPHGVEGQAPLPQAQLVQVVGTEGDDLHVDVRVGHPEDLHVDLVVLAEAPGLGPLVAEGRGQAPDLPGRRGSVLDEGPGHRRRGLGPQGQVAVTLVPEVVHLLADDVGAGSQPLEDLEVLEQGAVDQSVAEAGGDVGEGGDEGQPARRLRGQDVLGADRRAEGLRHS